MSRLVTYAAFVLFLAAASGRAEDAAPTRSLQFERDITPVLTKAGCNAGACHGSFQGRGGFSLSLLGFDPQADFEAMFLAGRGRRVSRFATEESLILQKAIGRVPHGGGARFAVNSESYRLLRDFIRDGSAPRAIDAASQPRDAKIDALILEADSLVLASGDKASLKVKARWDDGETREVTRWSLFDSRDSMTVEVSSNGKLSALRSGKSPVTVRFLGQVATVDVTVPYEGGGSLTGFSESNFIDRLAAQEWKRVGVTPAPLSSDAEFVRRVSLDLIGTLPGPEEVRAFLESTAKDKRARLIDSLLDRPEYVDYWSLKWSDLLRAHRRYVGDKGLETFRGWIRRSVRENRPVDEMTRELLTSQGDLFNSGPVSYFFIDAKPEELAETTAQVFLGVRLQCARCHHHPLEVWGQDDYYGLAAFFTRLKFKDAGKIGTRFGGPKSVRATRTPDANRKLQRPSEPRLLGGEAITGENIPDIRRPLAEWIASKENPFFARNFVNRYWAWLTGRGLVEPVDDLRATNPASIPALLDALTEDFVTHDFDVRHLLRTICNSRVYQLASNLNPQRDRDGALFTHRVPRRMQAEVLLDAVNQFAGTKETFNGQPPGTRAIALPDPTIGSYFLTTFGRPLRNSACDCARGSKPDLAQTLHLINGYAINAKIADQNGRLKRLLKADLNDADRIEVLYLASLSRKPTDEEREIVLSLLTEAPSREEAWQDVMWTLLNCSEFSFNH